MKTEQIAKAIQILSSKGYTVEDWCHGYSIRGNGITYVAPGWKGLVAAAEAL